MKTAQQYIDSLRARDLDLWIGNERIDNPVDHPAIRPAIDAVAQTYAMAHEPQWRDIATAESKLTGTRVNRFVNVFGDASDLTDKLLLQRELGRRTGTCFQRCVGMDALNALFIATWEAGETNHKRFVTWLKDVQSKDEMLCGAMTDSKGDRTKRPLDQPEQFLRIVERRADGVVIRGAKLHQTGAANAHQVLVLPGGTYRPGEEDFAVAAAIPIDAPGVTLLLGRLPSDDRRGTDDSGNTQYAGQECVVWFDNVFVPTERVFLDGEIDACATMLSAFAGFHRASYGGCKPGNFDVLIGATTALVEETGVRGRPAVRDKLVEMVHLSETIAGLGLAASHKATQHAAGVWQVDPMLANVCKQTVTRLPYQIGQLAEDLAGGLIATLPALESMDHPRLKHIMDNVSVSRARAKLLRLVEHMTYGSGAIPLRLECMHGAGSPAAQRISIERTYDWAGCVDAARSLAGLDPLAQQSGAAK